MSQYSKVSADTASVGTESFRHVLDAAHPGRAAFDAHAKTGMRHAAITAQIEIPFEGFFRQAVRRDLFSRNSTEVARFAAANYLAVAFGRSTSTPAHNLRVRDRASCRKL